MGEKTQTGPAQISQERGLGREEKANTKPDTTPPEPSPVYQKREKHNNGVRKKEICQTREKGTGVWVVV